jgi:hypothetical protein
MIGKDGLGGVIERQRVSAPVATGSLSRGRGKDAALGKQEMLSTFPPPRRRGSRNEFYRSLLRNKEDETTVERRAGKPVLAYGLQ